MSSGKYEESGYSLNLEELTILYLIVYFKLQEKWASQNWRPIYVRCWEIHVLLS